jgi:hypothetical protein
VSVTRFGDNYYAHEAILWVWNWTKDEQLKDWIRQVYQWHIMGTQGLLIARENGVWWPLSTPWTNSKAGGIPLVLVEFQRDMVYDSEVEEAVRRCTIFLCHPEFARRIGVMTAPELPWGDFGGAATGFAGLALAELVEAGVIYLKTDEARFDVFRRLRAYRSLHPRP